MFQTDQILGIIPARMASTRFPGKPLADIGGIPMVVRVYRQASKVLKRLIIATGDDAIAEVAEQEGIPCILTRHEHRTGTGRCREAFSSYLRLSADAGPEIRAVINIQGDEPMVSPAAIRSLALDITLNPSGISTLVRPETDSADFLNPNRVKVVTDAEGYALYFSRAPIPFQNPQDPVWHAHVGMYAFRTEIFAEISGLEPGKLESFESLEQLRWLELGYRIHCVETEYQGFGIDTPEDLERLLQSGLV